MFCIQLRLSTIHYICLRETYTGLKIPMCKATCVHEPDAFEELANNLLGGILGELGLGAIQNYKCKDD